MCGEGRLSYELKFIVKEVIIVRLIIDYQLTLKVVTVQK